MDQLLVALHHSLTSKFTKITQQLKLLEKELEVIESQLSALDTLAPQLRAILSDNKKPHECEGNCKKTNNNLDSAGC